METFFENIAALFGILKAYAKFFLKADLAESTKSFVQLVAKAIVAVYVAGYVTGEFVHEFSEKLADRFRLLLVD